MHGCFKQEGKIQGIWDPPFIDILSGVCPHKPVNFNKPVLFMNLQPPDREARHPVRPHGYSQVSTRVSDATSRLSSLSASVHTDPLPHAHFLSRFTSFPFGLSIIPPLSRSHSCSPLEHRGVIDPPLIPAPRPPSPLSLQSPQAYSICISVPSFSTIIWAHDATRSRNLHQSLRRNGVFEHLNMHFVDINCHVQLVVLC